ncbi:hypothetical protein FHG08_13305 [Pseudoalteromonas sp. Scap03]|uniref:hypothetical protein n=1 Tax=unclassified Pseudoalteromonas TaxID=194690 RepID=UPI0015B98E47|nr:MULTISPECIES: hypothetical protein [unclassified Pseudoalteromonas]NWL16665.1 hypothetical protein [Pseudoalteromonas sp. Scap03]QLE81773.1 hypothetical protein FLM54_09560 [Pseudoalteromonas sp. Scap25]QLE89717.1 hypothetical protein FLM47_09555 [Pseudoalteromonas sp. Scap06]
MLELDLRAYKCPQQFIQFKLGLREAISLNQTITFNISSEQNTDDIERYLQKKMYYYKLNKQQALLLVEPLRV